MHLPLNLRLTYDFSTLILHQPCRQSTEAQLDDISGSSYRRYGIAGTRRRQGMVGNVNPKYVRRKRRRRSDHEGNHSSLLSSYYLRSYDKIFMPTVQSNPYNLVVKSVQSRSRVRPVTPMIFDPFTSGWYQGKREIDKKRRPCHLHQIVCIYHLVETV